MVDMVTLENVMLQTSIHDTYTESPQLTRQRIVDFSREDIDNGF